MVLVMRICFSSILRLSAVFINQYLSSITITNNQEQIINNHYE